MTNNTIDKTIKEREKEYGSFTGNASMACLLKALMEDSKEWDALLDTQKEALHMIAHKISRILNGNPHNVDSWHDIAGYATLVENELRGYEEDNTLKHIEVKKIKEEAFIKFLDKNIDYFTINTERKTDELGYVPLAYIDNIGFIDIGDEYREKLQETANNRDIICYLITDSDYIKGTRALSVDAIYPVGMTYDDKGMVWSIDNLFLKCDCGTVMIAHEGYIGGKHHCYNHKLSPINFVE